MRRLGHDYEVSVYGYFVVAMDKRTNKEDVEDEAFHSVCDLYKSYTDVKVLDVKVTSFKTEEYFTFAEVTLDLRVKVSGGYDYEESYPEAEGVAEDVDCPVGVSLIECQAYDYEEVDTWEMWDY